MVATDLSELCVALQRDLAAERMENIRLREAFMVMKRAYKKATSVLDTCADLGITYPNMDTNLIHLMANRAAWEAWRGRQT